MSLQKLTRGIQDLFSGSLSSCGQVTLTPNATSTTVSHYGVSSNSVVLLTPLNADAALHSYVPWFVCSKGQFVINHSSFPESPIFRYHFHTPRA